MQQKNALEKPYSVGYSVSYTTCRNYCQQVDDPYGVLARVDSQITENDLSHVKVRRNVKHVYLSSGM